VDGPTTVQSYHLHHVIAPFIRAETLARPAVLLKYEVSLWLNVFSNP
jgi:hypothetical protein